MKVLTLVRAAVTVAAFSGLAVPVAFAQSQSEAPVVTLKSNDGFTQLRGRLLGFEGGKYRIETILGTMDVDAMQVTCEGEGCPEDIFFNVKFGIHGSNTIGAELMPLFIQGYADTLDATMVTEVGSTALEAKLRIIHENGREMAEIDLQAKGSATSYRSLAAGVADIGMSSSRIRDRDMPGIFNAGLQDPRGTDAEHVIGLDGLIVVVHPDNPIQSISIEELALIFSGTMTNWSQIGGPDQPINVFASDEATGTFQTFNSIVMAPYGVRLTAAAQRSASNIQLSDGVAGDRWGVGVTAAAYERAARALPIRQECGILSFPTSFSMKTEEYPLSRRLYLYTPRTEMTVHARKLVEYAKSESAQPLIDEAGFVSLAVESATINNQGARLVHALTGEEEVSLPLLREFVTDVKQAARLSTTFRFTPGASGLDPKSQQDAIRFARDIVNGVYAGKEIMLIGFTDSVGQFELNRGLSARRAQVVADALRAAVEPGALDTALITVKGFGELAPVGCNTTPSGRSSNRRVEVWVRDPV